MTPSEAQALIEGWVRLEVASLDEPHAVLLIGAGGQPLLCLGPFATWWAAYEFTQSQEMEDSRISDGAVHSAEYVFVPYVGNDER